MESIGLLIYASLFVYAGINHIRNHASLAGYTASVLGDCPVKQYLAPLGGIPTGVALIAGGIGAAFGSPVALYGLAGFLTVATALFHRNFLSDETFSGFKGVALIGASLALASLV